MEGPEGVLSGRARRMRRFWAGGTEELEGDWAVGVDVDATGVTFHAAVSDELSDGIDMMWVGRMT